MEELRTRRALEALQAGVHAVRIQYENGEGEVSQRAIVPLEFYERWGHHYVRAYCYRRRERRTFALRRMEILEACATGSETGFDFDSDTGPDRSAQAAPAVPAKAKTSDPTVVQIPGPAASKPQSSNHRTAQAQVQTPAAPSNPPAQAEKDTGPSGLAGFFRLTFTIAGLAVILWALLSSGFFSEYYSGGDHGSNADSYQASFRGSEDGGDSGAGGKSGAAGGAGTGSTTPAPPANWTYRGYRLARGSGGRVMAAQAGRSFDSGRKAHYWINSHLFYQRTGLSDGHLLARYMGADTDRNGHLSWREVEAFQQQTYRLFTYRANSRALPPDEFLAQRGGDCEDFALYTCGLLEFWGWNCKVASFYPPGAGSGHAIAMVWSARPISGYGYIHVSGDGAQGPSGSTRTAAYTTAYLRPGYWIPIDYDSIGRFSEAMSSNWTLWDLDDPVELYGAVM